MNTYGDISPRTAAFAAKRLLERGQYLMVTERFGQVDPQGKNKTKTRKWRRYESLPRATAPLAEGIPPAGQKLTYTDIEVTLEQYGDMVELTDVIMDTHEDDVLKQSMDLCGEQAGETVEVLRINVLKAGTNVFYANSAATRIALASPPLRGDFRKVVRAFKRNKAREISQIIGATAKISTEAVAPAYFALGHTDLDSDLRGLSGFIPVEKYSDHTKALEGEIGKIESVRIILTALFEPWAAAATTASTQTTYLTNGSSGTGSADVYPLIIVARDAYGIVPLQGKNAVTPMVVNPGTPTVGNPLGQLGFVSWKCYQASVILNELWIARLECLATADPV